MLKRKLLIIFLLFNSLLLFSKEYGLVLSGGGGKGAYQVGVWKALNEYGIASKITAISGASVGGLNAALFASESIDKIENLWIEDAPEYMVNDYETISQNGLGTMIDGVNICNITNLLYPEIYVDALRDSDWEICYFKLNNYRDTDIKQLLLATSAVPLLCDKIFFENDFYSDGGGLLFHLFGNNLPWEPIEEMASNPKFDIDTIFLVYLKDKYLDNLDFIPGFKIIPIIPSEWLGGLILGTLNFNRNNIRYLIELGYKDTVKVLQENNYFPVSDFWFQ
ncbi:MAG: patatin-like phospholipase family protein [Treponema sp.]|nr:patatin-like phospholipase family protein [Treponema sp.]